jgi:acyl-coenzyme A thioesterase PaaI-like protein
MSSILGKLVFPREPEIPAWEAELQERHGLRRRDEMSRMAKSSADGCLMVHPPRIYVHAAPGSEGSGASASPGPPSEDDKHTTFAVWHFGHDSVGHPGVVHGGAISMAVDESCGFAFFALERGLGFTAYLHVNYRQPLPSGTPVLVTVKPKKIDGRKVTLEATVTDGGSKVFADGEALFVQPRNGSASKL